MIPDNGVSGIVKAAYSSGKPVIGLGGRTSEERQVY